MFFIRANPWNPWSIWMRSGIAGRRRGFEKIGRRGFERMSITSPNQPDRANRRQPLGFREPLGEAGVSVLPAAVAHPGRWTDFARHSKCPRAL